MQSQDVTIEVDGQPMPCYLARPDGDGAVPAVIVLQEIFGVNTEVRRITDLVASGRLRRARASTTITAPTPSSTSPIPGGRAKRLAAAAAVTKADCAERHRGRDRLARRAAVRRARARSRLGLLLRRDASRSSRRRCPGSRARVSFYGGRIARRFPERRTRGARRRAGSSARRCCSSSAATTSRSRRPRRADRSRARSGQGKRFEIQVYPKRATDSSARARETECEGDVADAWDASKRSSHEHLA